MDKKEKEQIDQVDEDSKQVAKLEGDIKKSFRIIIGFAGFILLGLILLAIYAHFADTTYTTQEGLPSEYTYNKYPFSKNGNLWQTQLFKETDAGLQQYDILVYFSPKQLENLSIDEDLYKTIYDTELIVLALNDSSLTQDGSSAQAAIGAIELGKIIGTKYNILNKKSYTAVIDPTQEISDGIRVVDCSIVSENKTAVIVFGLANETRVYQGDDGCIHVDGTSGTEIIRAADRFMYQITGVMRVSNE